MKTEANRLRILYFLAFCSTAAWLPILADHFKQKGMSGIEIGILMSVTPFMMFLVQPVYGLLADRLGYKKCLVFSSILASISFLFYLIDGGFIYLLLVTALMSVFYNTIQPLLDSLSLRLVQKDPKFSYGTLRIAGAAGWAFTGIITGYLIDKIDTSVIFIISSISLFLTFLVSITLEPDTEKPIGQADQSYKNIGQVLANKTLLFLLLAVALISAGASTIWYFYSIYIKEIGGSSQLVGYGLSLQGLCELPLFYLSARIILRFGIKTTLLITVFTTAFRLLLYSLVNNPKAAIAIELLHGISWSLFWVVCVEYVNKLVAIEWRATGQSLLTAAYYGVGAILGNLWGGYLLKINLRVGEIYLLNAGIVAVVGLMIWVLMRRTNVKM